MNSTQPSATAIQQGSARLFQQRADANMLMPGPGRLEGERGFGRSLFSDSVRADPDPSLTAMRRRRANLGHRIAALRGQGRVARVCLYARAMSDAEVPARSLEAVSVFAAQEGWHARTGRVFTDQAGPSSPTARPGWIRVQQHVRSGYADGVVALTHSAISLRCDEYETQLQWFADHFGFIALVHPEIPLGQR
ncbi:MULTISPECIES: hypothetical protein [unclassified Streptomyces]|uniref:hypothetical protein n=1 Tax=unclassified Streptomyces TaxID=2593676 RepID=UPI002DD82542|nr:MULTISPECIES: hypothetical protein [unclassified Streptomyces]WSA96642.1 hypothetical protein OIE63_37645 [Streptomyces sp. NBC_01795]WSB81057.1 hypothetical protein OHB04_38765 [Streptomyces sp. NBC_01775]WSS10733.1 hypothetical protein OG533_01495 [Streptomyces sp. NBC_01186]WSS39428.1 hypothetical protein OG220_01520 [Streptomyces sp. NBC_01187]